jgi:AmiR/NasT family two-component response regulator
VIGQAKGILMERFGVKDDQAFQMLVQSSQDTNVKLVDVSRWLTTGAGRPQTRPCGEPDPLADAPG